MRFEGIKCQIGTSKVPYAVRLIEGFPTDRRMPELADFGSDPQGVGLM